MKHFNYTFLTTNKLKSNFTTISFTGTMHVHCLLNIKGGPSATDLKDAYATLEKEKKDGPPSIRNQEIKRAQEEVLNFTEKIGVTAMHPQHDVQRWPGPEGQAIHRPAPEDNILRQKFMDLLHEDEFMDRYERLLNRCMLHKCRLSYCLDPKRRDKETGNYICRFNFPFNYTGYVPVYDVNGEFIKSFRRDHDVEPKVPDGEIGVIVGGNLHLLRNHQREVFHTPELLSLWGANVSMAVYHYL